MCHVQEWGSQRRNDNGNTLERDATILVFKGVPALVCDQCGESYTDREVTRRLLQIVDEEAQKGPNEEFIQFVA